MTKNELRTLSAVAFAQAAIRKIGIDPDMNRAVQKAFSVWKCKLTKRDIKQSSKWLEEFERALWKGEEQEAHTHLSFAVAILEKQSEFLRGRKLKAIDEIIVILLMAYNDLPESLHSEDFCSDLASRAVSVWEEIIYG